MQRFAADGVAEAKARGVQSLARKGKKRIADGGWQGAGSGWGTAQIDRIPHQGMAKMGHMHADLMCPPGQ